MSLEKNSNTNFPLDGINSFVALEGLLDFIKILEKDFFATIKLHWNYHADSEKTDLILELFCNYGLTESLHHFNHGNWGGFSIEKGNPMVQSSFGKAFQKLCDNNANAIDIAEASFHFKDTSIIVTRIYEHSVPEQLGEVIFKISEHFVHFTKGLTEMPYEIFVPVFEDPTQNVFEIEQNYFDYWGIYFENDTQHNAMVYNLKTKQLSKEDFFLLE
ncbi:MAG: hypothetical protein ABJN84_11070 [Flavobacteriaceae bacterium]